MTYNDVAEHKTDGKNGRVRVVDNKRRSTLEPQITEDRDYEDGDGL